MSNLPVILLVSFEDVKAITTMKQKRRRNDAIGLGPIQWLVARHLALDADRFNRQQTASNWVRDVVDDLQTGNLKEEFRLEDVIVPRLTDGIFQSVHQVIATQIECINCAFERDRCNHIGKRHSYNENW